MLKKIVITCFVPLLLSGCSSWHNLNDWLNEDTRGKPVAAAAEIAEPLPAPEIIPDVIAPMNTDPSVTVYPLTGGAIDPFTRKNLQPISSKVIGEGYPVLDPSVQVFPLRPPSSMPAVTFENVNQAGAASSLYSARVQSLTAQKEAAGEPVFPNFPNTIGASLLPPVAPVDSVPLPPINAPMSDEAAMLPPLPIEALDIADRPTDFMPTPIMPTVNVGYTPMRPGSVSAPIPDSVYNVPKAMQPIVSTLTPNDDVSAVDKGEVAIPTLTGY